MTTSQMKKLRDKEVKDSLQSLSWEEEGCD